MRITKNELIDKLKKQEDDLRRLRRSLAMSEIDLPAREFINPSSNETTVSEHSREALQRGFTEWDNNVTEPEYNGDWQRINTYIKGAAGIGWTWESDYVRNGQFAWCGAFAAFCYTKIRSKIRSKIFPSCYRLWDNWGGTHRKVSNISPGDIVVVYTSTSHSPSYGNHITIACSYLLDDGDFETIEGNAKGPGPNGKIEGVIRRKRNIKDVAHIYRPSSEDYDE